MSRDPQPGQRGAILVMALLVALILLGVGLALLSVSTTMRRASEDLGLREEAVAAAEAGVEHARAILERSADWDRLLWGCSCAEDDPDRAGSLLCDGLACQRELPAGEEAGAAGRFTIWIRNDWMEECDVHSQVWDLREADCDDDGRPGSAEDKRFAMKDHNGRVIVLVEGRARAGGMPVRLEAIFTRRTGRTLGTGDYAQEGLGAAGSNALPDGDL